MNTIKELHENLKIFLYRKDVFELLEEAGCGWLDGGCRSLMKAIALWLGEEHITYYQIVKHPNDNHSEHALIKVGNFFLDGDGISTYDEMLHRWLTEELVGIRNGILYIQMFNPGTEPPHKPTGEKPFYIEEDKILLLSAKLEETFDKENVLKTLKEQR
ncbi:hypothetical protein QTG56_23780 (plasmid) [Rossellomorea sp. AcN35-11]|nr:hypothetical protein [Rossellomorea aquimaris]WJV32382.1 hypothetical protein QTG56_23780 [Rossellomorea sp. AcN35-11]